VGITSSTPIAHLSSAIEAAQLGHRADTTKRLAKIFETVDDQAHRAAIRGALAMSLGSAIPVLSECTHELLNEHTEKAFHRKTAVTAHVEQLESEINDLSAGIKRLQIAVELAPLLDEEAAKLLKEVRELEEEVGGKISRREEIRESLKRRLKAQERVTK
jgi:predicted RNase H-like nuclease (RuvC/YqgF family)